jgi:cytochrome c-type biogenesis protein CcmH
VSSNWIFWAIVAAFVLVALALVLPPLFRRKPAPVKVGRRNINIAVYRDQMKEMEVDRANGLINDEQFDAAKLELEARLAQDAVDTEDVQPVNKGGRILGISLAILIPVFSIAIYWQLGMPQAAEGTSSAMGQPTSRDIQAMLKSAEDKVKTNPDDARTWVLLARAYGVLENWPAAIRAYENLVRLIPQDAGVWSHYGEALALSNNRDLNGKPMAMVRKALELDPKDIKGLELSGIYAYQNKDYKQAVQYWQKVVDLSPPGEQYTQDMQSALDKAKGMAGEGASKPLDNLSSFSEPQQAASGKSLAGTVSIAGNLKDKVAAGDVVFIFASDSQAGGPPLAAIKLAANTLPAEFRLDDSQAMAPGNTLSSHASVKLTARISKSGNPTPEPGDLEGSLTAVKVGSSGIKLVIDRVR